MDRPLLCAPFGHLWKVIAAQEQNRKSTQLKMITRANKCHNTIPPPTRSVVDECVTSSPLAWSFRVTMTTSYDPVSCNGAPLQGLLEMYARYGCCTL